MPHDIDRLKYLHALRMVDHHQQQAREWMYAVISLEWQKRDRMFDALADAKRRIDEYAARLVVAVINATESETVILYERTFFAHELDLPGGAKVRVRVESVGTK